MKLIDRSIACWEHRHALCRALVIAALISTSLGCRNEVSPSTENVSPRRTSVDTKLELASSHLRRREASKAIPLLKEVLVAEPTHPQAVMMAFGALVAERRYCEAAELADQAIESNPALEEALAIRTYDAFLRCGDFANAEGVLARLIERVPNHIEGHRQYAQLLNAQGRRHEASEHVYQLIRLQAVRPNEILSLVDRTGPFLLVAFHDFVDPAQVTLFSLTEARNAYVLANRDPGEVQERLERLIQAFPDQPAVAAFYGRFLAENSLDDEFAKWLVQLPPGIDAHPEYWAALGTWLERENRADESIRAFGEALRHDPTDRQSLRSIIRVLIALGKEDETEPLRERLATLDQIFRIAKDANQDQAEWIAERMQELGRPWDAIAWQMYAAQLGGQLTQSLEGLQQRHQAIVAWESRATRDQIEAATLRRLLGFDIQQWPLPKVDSLSPSTRGIAATSDWPPLRLDDVASEVGIRTTFVSGFPLDGSPFYPHQVNGGGLAAGDYNLDGYCDLYVVQSGGNPSQPLSSMPNQLYRQRPDGRFEEVAVLCGVDDKHYGQGVTVGDVNQDGFPDLLIANIGSNSLYINQGDGTFKEASSLLPDNKPIWTSCLALADLDGDHLPDMVEVNYLDDPEAYRIACDKNYVDCQPHRFRKGADRFFRCNRDGTYAAWPSADLSLVSKPGFGVIIANFDRELGNDVFIANDGDFNHFWKSTSVSEAGAPYSLVESANVQGCSVGRDGDSQACMGVASGDFNRDGTLDLHITNFHNEPVNLFLQTRSGYFSDEAQKYGLVEPSFKVLGFGTQAVDFDNDGWLDIAVLNGHVFDARHEQTPFQMKPQLFRGGDGRFDMQEQALSGAYWEREQLGRTLLAWDWDRDGRVDLAANHLEHPIAILSNQSPANDWIQFELCGVTAERDAIGAEIRVETGDGVWHGWNTGGDGYMCSNEPVVPIGLGPCDSTVRVEVRWPSGATQVFSDLAPNARYLLIENERDPYKRW